MTGMQFLETGQARDRTYSPDKALSALNRFETSVTMPGLLDTEVLVEFQRSGLGLWAGAIVSQDPLVFVAAPVGDDGAGCSIWHDPTIEPAAVAAIIVALLPDPDQTIHFITTEGEEIQPENGVSYSLGL